MNTFLKPIKNYSIFIMTIVNVLNFKVATNPLELGQVGLVGLRSVENIPNYPSSNAHTNTITNSQAKH